jgi:hypothetical protein
MIALLGVATLLLAGCWTTGSKKGTFLTDDEIAALKTKQPCVLSPALRRKMLEHGEELHLTPEEQQVLKSTGKVILCGRCGYIINSLKYKRFEKNGGKRENFDSDTEFAKDSLRNRLLKPTVID